MTESPYPAGRVVLEALRLDLESEPEVRDRAQRALDLSAGGFILFGGSMEVVGRLIEDLLAEAGRPLWFGSDLERGPGQQFAGMATLPPPAGLAVHPDSEAATREAGRITGLGARALGINLVFSPVLDLDIEPRNPIVGTRAFSADPAVVARLGGAWIDGCQSEGVLACAKHFPGHGRTIVDSHAEIPVVNATREQLEADLLPFRRVIGDVGAILSAHVSYPGLGTDRPATIAPPILTDLLRIELGFEGLIVTDAMNMSGFLDAGDRSGSAAVSALLAGCDLLLYPADFEATTEVLGTAANGNPDARRRLAEAADRSTRSLARLEAEPSPGTSTDSTDADRIASGCIAWLKEAPGWLTPGARVGVRAIWDDREQPDRSPLGTEFADLIEDAGFEVDNASADVPQLVLVASTPQAWKGTAGLTAAAESELRVARDGAADSLTIVFGHARLAHELDAAVCAWGTEPVMERAAACAVVRGAV